MNVYIVSKYNETMYKSTNYNTYIFNISNKAYMKTYQVQKLKYYCKLRKEISIYSST